MTNVTLAKASPNQPDVQRLIEASDAHLAALYPAESNHAPDLDGLAQPNVFFLVASIDRRAVGCACLIPDADGGAEIKRMYVAECARGRGIGKLLMKGLNEEARRMNLKCMRLETGIHQPEAIALYQADGFVKTGPFGAYKPDPLSVFMVKNLQ